MTPGLKCAEPGRCNAAPVFQVENLERINGPITWPKWLDEATGRVNPDWEAEMMKIRIAFWTPLGARMIKRTIKYDVN